MIVRMLPKVAPTSDPYEEDCCGNHLGEVIEVVCEEGIVIRVEQHDSGIGSSWTVVASREGHPPNRSSLTVHTADADEFHVVLEAR